jgi:deoxyribodipyrimidine photolyase-related protein
MNTPKLYIFEKSIEYWVKKIKAPKINIVELEDNKSFYKDIKNKRVHVCEILDKEIEKKLEKSKPEEIIIYESPSFLASDEFLDTFYHGKVNKRQTSFYMQLRREMDLLINKQGKPVGGKWTYDSDNRQRVPDNLSIPKTKDYKVDEKLVKKICNKLQRPLWNGKMYFPTTRKEALKRLKQFVKIKLNNFGPYQDAIVIDDIFLWHSAISSSLNIGLITPEDVLEEVMEAYDEGAKLQSVEGFIRQVIGWREWSRYCYIYLYKDIVGKNYFNNRKRLDKSWYDGTTGIEPLDDAIKTAWDVGYLHHILRLMLVGNLMTLMEIHPKEVFKWFMEFAVDSYDWVMVNNVYSMATYSDGGETTTKPYISSSAYFLKQSNYSRGEWNKDWDALYRAFVYKHKSELVKNARMALYVKNAKKPTPDEYDRVAMYV